MLTGDVFVQEGLITPEQLQLATEKQLEMGGDDPIARVMVEMGLISERDRVRCMGKVWGARRDVVSAEWAVALFEKSGMASSSSRWATRSTCSS